MAPRDSGPGAAGCGWVAHLDLGSFEDLDGVALADLDDRLLPARLRAADRAATLRLRADVRDVHVLDADVEELLDGLADLGLVRVLVHLEGVLAVGDQG